MSQSVELDHIKEVLYELETRPTKVAEGRCQTLHEGPGFSEVCLKTATKVVRQGNEYFYACDEHYSWIWHEDPHLDILASPPRRESRCEVLAHNGRCTAKATLIVSSEEKTFNICWFHGDLIRKDSK